MKVGQGFDAHRLVAGRPLVIGGVTVPFELGLMAHSDGDVLLHAITDAILGALGQGDIGQHFPDADPAWKDADSRLLLKEVVELMHAQGWCIGNLDATIIAQRPKMLDYLPAMSANLSADLQCAPTQLNLKATTTEWLGFTGRGEGIAALAMVLLAAVD